jgi:hypothetical protein
MNFQNPSGIDIRNPTRSRRLTTDNQEKSAHNSFSSTIFFQPFATGIENLPQDWFLSHDAIEYVLIGLLAHVQEGYEDEIRVRGCFGLNINHNHPRQG